ncbi:hypothetical protein GCM10017714_02590 [Curtobacterium pusillum]|uniref:PH domain-containing protein n=1 Tax=Curtobacterium pusillum TaxID=69373 RepID=A0AAW3TA74_9MICO|nr:hypothetical protein [Curtobacterium pusillum]MBA8991805.1 hypothetical protein [Curtobacterium pusillum]NUU12346.1 hypothetical protein [Curtobacterium pusillum]GLK31248.1 hypothetical protein GCM10017610_15330 [Curtobacterium pusillum]
MGDLTAPAAARPRATAYDVVLRPRRSLVRSTILSVVFSAVPLAVALVWVSLPLRLWTFVATVVIVLAVHVGIVFVRLGTAFIGIDPVAVTIRGVVTPNRRVARDRVHSLVLATTYGSAVERTTRELVAFDAAGAHLFRLRADTWGDTGIDRVVEALGVQVTDQTRPMSLREFVRRYPASRAWYEQRGAYVAVAVAATLAVAGLLVIETAGLVGG